MSSEGDSEIQITRAELNEAIKEAVQAVSANTLGSMFEVQADMLEMLAKNIDALGVTSNSDAAIRGGEEMRNTISGLVRKLAQEFRDKA